MPPKKAVPVTWDDLAEFKASMDFLSEKVDSVSNQQEKLMVLLAQVQLLKTESMEKDKKITTLENRVADLEQYSRINDLIINGLKTKHRSYARAAAAASEDAGSQEPTEAEAETLEKQVVGFLEEKGITVESRDIEACHTLPNKIKSAIPAIIIRFTNRKSKDALLKQGRKLKGTQVYINEHLTKKNADIAKKARSLKKQDKIQGTWTSSCKVFIKYSGASPEESAVMVVRNISDLDKFEKERSQRAR